MTVRDEFRISIAAVIDDRFMYAAKTGAGVRADEFETERLDDIDHVIGAATVCGQNLNLGWSACRLLRSRRGRPNHRSRACQHPAFEKFPSRRNLFLRHA